MRIKLTIIKAVFICKLNCCFKSTVKDADSGSHLFKNIGNSFGSTTSSNKGNFFMFNTNWS